MIHPTATDITELLKQLTKLLQPFAESHGIVVGFKPNKRRLVLFIRPDVIIMDITSLVCNIISYTPQGNTITIAADIEEQEFKIRLNNTGINLSLISEITQSCKQPVMIKGNTETKQTLFEWSLSLSLFGEDQANSSFREALNEQKLPKYYDEIRKRLRSHFSKGDNLVAHCQ
jgi:hypothetical protein